MYKELPGPIDGYKIVNRDMTCKGVKFTVGIRAKLTDDSPLELCKHGFHFCSYPSGVWAYYGEGRVFKCRAWGVLDLSVEPGADRKLVAREIELLEEIKIGGSRNTGNQNTGDQNTGDQNTGSRNTGDQNTGSRNTGNQNTGDHNTGSRNTGNQNTGDHNTGSRNTGYQNTGYRNTGDQNTGYQNTGDQNTGDQNTGSRNTGYQNAGYRNTGSRNTGDHNTGDQNTGDQNTGNQNTGYGNACDYSSGYFCSVAPLYFFDRPVKIDRASLDVSLIDRLSIALSSDDPFDPNEFLGLPNATRTGILNLHLAHITRRAAMRAR